MGYNEANNIDREKPLIRINYKNEKEQKKKCVVKNNAYCIEFY